MSSTRGRHESKAGARKRRGRGCKRHTSLAHRTHPNCAPSAEYSHEPAPLIHPSGNLRRLVLNRSRVFSLIRVYKYHVDSSRPCQESNTIMWSRKCRIPLSANRANQIVFWRMSPRTCWADDPQRYAPSPKQCSCRRKANEMQIKPRLGWARANAEDGRIACAPNHHALTGQVVLPTSPGASSDVKGHGDWNLGRTFMECSESIFARCPKHSHTLSHNVGNSRMLICGLARPTPARERKLGADQDRRTCAPSPQTLDNNNIAPLRKDTTRCLRIVWRHAPNTP